MRSRNHKQAVWAVYILAVCAGINAAASTIVVVRTPVDVSIAADSMATFGDGSTARVCKIYRLGEVFLGVAGTDHDAATSFNVAGIVSTAIRNVSKPADKITSARTALTSEILTEAKNLMSGRPQEFENVRRNGVSIALVGLDGTVPFVVGQHFTVRLDSKNEIQIVPSKALHCPGLDCPQGVYELHMGEADLIQKRMDSHPRITDSVDFARELVQLEIDAHVKGVGGPIDLLRISASGPTWVRRKPACPIEVIPGSSSPKP